MRQSESEAIVPPASAAADQTKIGETVLEWNNNKKTKKCSVSDCTECSVEEGGNGFLCVACANGFRLSSDQKNCVKKLPPMMMKDNHQCGVGCLKCPDATMNDAAICEQCDIGFTLDMTTNKCMKSVIPKTNPIPRHNNNEKPYTWRIPQLSSPHLILPDQYTAMLIIILCMISGLIGIVAWWVHNRRSRTTIIASKNDNSTPQSLCSCSTTMTTASLATAAAASEWSSFIPASVLMMVGMNGNSQTQYHRRRLASVYYLGYGSFPSCDGRGGAKIKGSAAAMEAYGEEPILTPVIF